VHVDGAAVRSCVVALASVAGKKIRTIEDLGRDQLTKLQQAWIRHQVPQCGYCQSGMLMAARALLDKIPTPTDADIDREITNICRCGTYQRIRAAIKDASTAAPGRARGIALHQSFGSIVAQVAEVALVKGDKGLAPKVHRVMCAIDCGTVINPDIVAAQMESGIVFGLTAALYGEITIKGGAVEQKNFPDYEMLRMADMPRIETHIVASAAFPGGVGEAGTPPLAPALANALYKLTGKPVRSLPIRLT